MDDELNILPTISRSIGQIEEKTKGNALQDKMMAELKTLQESLADSKIIGTLIQEAKTLDQAKALMMLMDALTQENFKYTVSITAARGRGKSAAIGLMMAAALKLGVTNIFVTAPSPENLQTLFEFVFKGLDLLGFKENGDYEII